MKRWIFATAAASVLALAVVLAAGAAGTTTYHGVFAGPVVYKGCDGAPPSTVASGTWTVALHGQAEATLTVNIFTNGEHHVSFGGTFPLMSTRSGQVFAVGIPTEAGPLVVSLTGTVFTYRIAPYDAFGLTCKSVTYSGVLTG
ncbi:MAG: hypothetical protein ACXVR9_12890 [Gaiellaceae bacterium]